MSPRFEQWYRSLAKFLKVTVGDVSWAPPPWIASLRVRAAALRARAAANPRAFRRNAMIAVELAVVVMDVLSLPLSGRGFDKSHF